MREPDASERELHEHAGEAARHAHVPYSRFPVGAALRTAGGGIVTGANVENASYGLTCCAERTAMFTAVAAGHREFDAIAVHAQAASAPPCGACRQVLAEFAPELVIVYQRDGELVACPLAELLPEQFRL